MFGERRTMMKPRRNALNVAISTLMMLLLISGCGKPSEEREVKGILAGEDADSLGEVSTSEESAASSEDADSPDEFSTSEESTAPSEDADSPDEVSTSEESAASSEDADSPDEIEASGEAAASSEKDVKPEEIAALKESAASGDDSAQNKLCRFFCESPNKLSTDDFAWFNKLAADGQPWAQFMLGVCYLVAEDPAQATAWMKKSKEEGFAPVKELLLTLPKELSEMLTPEGQKKLEARGAAMLDTFASEFMPKTHSRYKQISEKFALTSKTLADLETSIRENGGDPANDETYKVIYERGKTLSLQIYRIRDTLFGNYCYRKMEVFTSEDLLKRDNEFAAWVDAEFLTKKAAAPKGEQP